jgi:hypothetical protein
MVAGYVQTSSHAQKRSIWYFRVFVAKHGAAVIENHTFQSAQEVG